MSDANGKAILRWVGGKARLASQLKGLIPSLGDGERYYEPFLGAGSLFFKLGPARSVIGDRNDALMCCYKQVKRRPDLVWRHLAKLIQLADESSYYEAREAFNTIENSPRRAALFIYLNRTCFNGIWRVSRAGAFNVPYGAPNRTIFPTRKALFAVAGALRKAKLISSDFEDQFAERRKRRLRVP